MTTEIYSTMPRDVNEDSPVKRRERRHHSIQMRRLAAIQSANASPPSSSRQPREDIQIENLSSKAMAAQRTDGDLSSSSSSGPRDVKPEPVFGMMSVSGRRRDLEDEITTTTWLIGPENSRRQLLHFFAVYDGHGGPSVSALCAEKMHEFVLEELARVMSTRGVTFGGAAAALAAEEATWRTVMRRSFERIDEVALNTCVCGIAGGECGCVPMEVALDGCAVVAAVLTPHHIIVANCGDSRAVLCRAGTTIPLSDDHKPDRADELERIERAGGRVVFGNRARVEGILTMSRAIGDKDLKSVVISEPEITFTKRESDDEFLILGSDGLWDVLSSEMACKVTRGCLQGEDVAASIAAIDLNAVPEIEEVGVEILSPSRVAATLLTRLALGRKSSDNISVVVVDLKRS